MIAFACALVVCSTLGGARAGTGWARDRQMWAVGRSAVSGGMAHVAYLEQASSSWSPTASAEPPIQRFGCIDVETTVHDYGCAFLAPDQVRIDTLYGGASLTFTVPSFVDGSKRLRAVVRLESTSALYPSATGLGWGIGYTPDGIPSEVLADVRSSCLYRYGRVTGTISSDRAGGGQIQPYEGPPTKAGVALIFDCSHVAAGAGL